MSDTQQRVAKVVFEAIEELNAQRAEENWLEKSQETVLIGQTGKLDSLGFINLIALVEEKTQEEFGIEITLSHTSANFGEKNPFTTVRALSDYVSLLVERATTD